MGYMSIGLGGAYIMHCWHYGSAEGIICLYLLHDPVYNQEEQVLRGRYSQEEQVWTTECISRKAYVLIHPLPLMSKGESDFGVVAIKSKGGDFWHYDACVVLDGNPLIEEHLTYIQSDESTEEINRENRAYWSKMEPRGAERRQEEPCHIYMPKKRRIHSYREPIGAR